MGKDGTSLPTAWMDHLSSDLLGLYHGHSGKDYD